MRAAIFHGPGQPITIENIADPRPSADDVVIKVGRCGICGSDVSGTGDGPAGLPLGRFGHEWAGEIVELGRNVSSLRLGDRVSGLPKAPCGNCDGCRQGNPMFCEEGTFLVGGFGEYMAIPATATNPIPAGMDWAEGALIEPMACGLHALRLARMARGARVLVIGAGAMALSVIFWARRLGASNIAVLARSADREDVLMTLGADTVLGFGEEQQRRVGEALGGRPDIVAECVGKAGMLDLALRHVRPQGTVLSMGMCQHAEQIVPSYCAFKEVRLFFPVAYTVSEIAETTRAFDDGALDPAILVGETIALDRLPEAIERLRAGIHKGGKILVDPGAAVPAP